MMEHGINHRRDRPETKGDSSCSTPYGSAYSSPGRGLLGGDGGGCFSAPESPRRFALISAPFSTSSEVKDKGVNCSPDSFEFEFSSRCPSPGGRASAGSMTSADELFLNGQIRPMTLLTSRLHERHLLEPLPDEDECREGLECRRRDLFPRSRSVHRRTRSMSPLRSTRFDWTEEEVNHNEGAGAGAGAGDGADSNLNPSGGEEKECAPPQPAGLASSSRSSSSGSGRYSKRWIFLKDLLYRSKSEGRERDRDRSHAMDKFWNTISFSTSSSKAAKPHYPAASAPASPRPNSSTKQKEAAAAANGGSEAKRRGAAASAHERHYTANRAQAEEMRRRTFLPYRHGLLGCLVFTSRNYGAVNGILNSVTSRARGGGRGVVFICPIWDSLGTKSWNPTL